MESAPLSPAQVMAVVADSTGLPLNKVVGVIDAIFKFACHELKRVGHFKLSGWFRLRLKKTIVVKNKFTTNKIKTKDGDKIRTRSRRWPCRHNGHKAKYGDEANDWNVADFNYEDCSVVSINAFPQNKLKAIVERGMFFDHWPSSRQLQSVENVVERLCDEWNVADLRALIHLGLF